MIISTKAIVAVTAIMLLAVCGIVAVSDVSEADDAWDGTADISWYMDESQDEYEISTAEQLAGLAQLVNGGKTFEDKTIRLTANLDLSGYEWTPIGTGSRSDNTITGYSFQGTFEGDNHTISGITINAESGEGFGLFKFISTDTTIENLILSKVSITAYDSTGTLVGAMDGGTISNVKVTDGKVTGNKGVGGIVGRVLMSGTIEYCTNAAEVTANGYNAGGIAGAAYYANNGMTFTNCENTGSIDSVTCAGGIIGLSSADLYNCKNSGTISITKTGGTSIGGIVGEQKNDGSINNCENSGTVSNNVGTTTDGSTDKAGVGTGGIVGWIRYSVEYTNGHVTVSGCTNTENVSSSSYGVGGIVGLAYNSFTVTGCKSSGTITGYNMVAGIIGGAQTVGTPSQLGDYMILADNSVLDVEIICKEGPNKGEVIGHLPANIASTETPALWVIHGNTYVDEEGNTKTFTDENVTSAKIIVISPTGTGTATAARYDDLQTAFNSVTDGGTITLYDDFDVSTTIINDKSITLDLNGYKITGVSNDTVITNNGTLTLKNGTVDAGTANGSVAVSNNGTLTVWEDEGFSTLLTGCFAISGGTATSVLTITGGTFESNGSTDRSNALYVTGNVTITGGVFTSEGRSNAGLPRTSAIHITGDGSTLLINPGDEQVVVFSEDNYAITIEGDITATICGGTFTSDGPRDELYRANDIGSFVISGGTFAHEPSSDHIAEHHAVVREGNVYTVIPQPTIVNTSVTDIGLLANSLATNASVELTITITGNVTIPSGYDLTLKQGHTLIVQSGSTLTVEGILRLEGNLDNKGTVATAGSGYIEKILNMSAGGTEAGLPNLDDNGTYHVSTPMELQWLAFLVANGTEVTSVVLDDSIVMPRGVGFSEIGTYESPVENMVFDGQGHTISGIDMDQEPNVKYMGIFGQIVDTTIKNLNIDSADIDVMWSYAGILVGLAQGDCVIENVHISDSSIDGPGSFGLAAFVGYAGSGETSRSLQFIGCSANTVTINAQCNAGALWGTSSGYNSDIGVYNCSIDDVQISSIVTIGIYGGFGSTADVTLMGPESDADLTLAGNTVTGPTVGNQYPAPELSVGTAVLGIEGWSVLTQGMEPEARIDGKMFASIEDAIQLASDGDTIVLLADVTDGMTFDEDMTLTVDLNGQTIRNSDDLAVITVSSGSVTISGTGTFTPGSGGTTASVADGANLAIIGGTYTEDISDYVPDGYRVVEDTDSNTYTVVAEHTVTFVLSPSTAGVTVTDAQGNRYQVADGTIALIPGTYTITVSASGYTTQTQSLVIDSTSDISLTVSVTLSPRPSGGGGTATPDPEPDEETETITNPDGSTTTTTTRPDGSTTITTERPDGSSTTTDTKPVTGGTQTTVTDTDSEGNTTSTVTTETETTTSSGTTISSTVVETTDAEGNTTSTAESTYTSEDGGTVTEATVITDADGNTTATTSTIMTVESADGVATVTDSAVSEVVSHIDAVTGTADTSDGTISIVQTGGDGSVSVTISPEAIRQIAEAGVTLEIASDVGTVTASTEVAETLSQQSSSVSIVVREADRDQMASIQQEAVGDRPTYQLLAATDDGEIHELGGTVTVSVAYEISEGEIADSITVHYVRDDGSMEAQPTTYSNGTVTFTTTHFSYYTIQSEFEPSDSEDNTLLYAGIALVVIIVIAAIALFARHRA